ncbi:MAG: hypothetical protein IT243_02340 [Bacteroidia bacterium]|nr:hypothetical protein [Bacteroidia bacterium]
MLTKILVLCFYISIFIWFTFPLVLYFDSAYTGSLPNSDTNQYFWNIYNFKRCIYELKNPFNTKLLFYPFGSPLIMHTYTPIIGLFSLFFENNYLALNTFLLLNYVLSAYGVFILCRYLKSNFLLAVLAGFIYGFCPYKMLRLTEHYHLLLTAFVPFFVLFFLKGFVFKQKKFLPETVNVRYFIYCVLLGFGIFLSDYYATFYVIYFCLFYALYFKLVSVVNLRSLRFWIYTIVVLILSHISFHQFKVFGVDNKGGIWWSGDLLSYIIPSPNSMWFDFSYFRNIEKIIYHYPESVEYCMFTGFVFMGVIIFSFIIKRKMTSSEALKPFTFICFLFFLMTLPDFKVYGKSLLNNPVSIFHYIPFLNNLRSPTRMYPMLLFTVLPIITVVLSEFLKKIRYRNFLVLIIFVSTILEYKPKNYQLIRESEIPAMIKFLSKQPNGVLLNIPFGIRDGFVEFGSFNTNKLFYQTKHNKPMTDGYISRLDKDLFANCKTDFYNKIVKIQNGETLSNCKLKMPKNIRYILIEKKYIKSFEPVFDDILLNIKFKKYFTSKHLLYKIY